MAENSIFARARPASVKLSESYFFVKKLSRNPFIGRSQSPIGKIEIIMPYDGDQYFTRQAYNDVKKQLNNTTLNGNLEAQFGHLAFINHDGTDLREILDLNNHYGSFPLRVPILGHEITSIDQLYSDTLTSIVKFDYSPKWPTITPIDVLLELWDEETLNWSGNDKPEEDEQLAHIAQQITQQINFRPNLLIKCRVYINLPSRIVKKGVRPRLKQLSLKWPTLTSFRGLNLQIGFKPTEEQRVTYNPQTRSLEWGNVLMTEDAARFSSAEVKTFSTDWMDLFTDYPGELYEQSSIEGQADVEIPGLLLSGTQVRLFNAIGEIEAKHKPNVVTRVTSKFELVLDEAFSRRKLSPYQHLYFDEVIPDEMRIADIKTAIADQGFRIVQDKSLSTDKIKHFIKAERPEGPDKMELSILIEGKRQEAERETQVKGGQKFKSNTESGFLRVYIRGEMPGNIQRLTQEMNAFQNALNERFERLKSRR